MPRIRISTSLLRVLLSGVHVEGGKPWGYPPFSCSRVSCRDQVKGNGPYRWFDPVPPAVENCLADHSWPDKQQEHCKKSFIFRDVPFSFWNALTSIVHFVTFTCHPESSRTLACFDVLRILQKGAVEVGSIPARGPSVAFSSWRAQLRDKGLGSVVLPRTWSLCPTFRMEAMASVMSSIRENDFLASGT